MVACLLLFVFFAVTTGSKIYYLAGAYAPLLAAGVVALDGWLSVPRHLRILGAGLAVTTVAALPIVLPVLPASDIGWTYAINQVPGESVGWPELVNTVADAWHGLPDSAVLMSHGVPAEPAGDTSQDQPPRYPQPPAPRGESRAGSGGSPWTGEPADPRGQQQPPSYDS